MSYSYDDDLKQYVCLYFFSKQAFFRTQTQIKMKMIKESCINKPSLLKVKARACMQTGWNARTREPALPWLRSCGAECLFSISFTLLVVVTYPRWCAPPGGCLWYHPIAAPQLAWVCRNARFDRIQNFPRSSAAHLTYLQV